MILFYVIHLKYLIGFFSSKKILPENFNLFYNTLKNAQSSWFKFQSLGQIHTFARYNFIHLVKMFIFCGFVLVTSVLQIFINYIDSMTFYLLTLLEGCHYCNDKAQTNLLHTYWLPT